MNNITSKSTKAEILQASEEYISHLEETLYQPQQVAFISLIAILLGFFSGLHY